MAHEDDTPPKWHVAMLGSTSAGKTCYIGSFYSQYKGGESGQSVESDEFNNRSDFEVIGNQFTKGHLKNIDTGLRQNPPITPDPTKKIVDYGLFLTCRDGDDLIERELALHDHAGEALAGSTDPAMAAEFDAVIERLKKADGFIAFLDASQILAGDSGGAAAATDWDTMHDILTKVAARLRRGGDSLPVVLVLSKFDVAETPEDRERVLEFARERVKSLHAVQKNMSILICPVSVLRSSKAQPGTLERNFLNVAVPFFFASAAIILRNAAWHATQVEHHRERGREVELRIRQNKEAMRGLFAGLFRRIINLSLRVGKMVSVDTAIGREVRLQENDIAFAGKAIDYLLYNNKIVDTEFYHLGNSMNISEYVEMQAAQVRE